MTLYSVKKCLIDTLCAACPARFHDSARLLRLQERVLALNEALGLDAIGLAMRHEAQTHVESSLAWSRA